MEKENRPINLLGDKGKNTSDAFLTWAVYIGRLLVIITETIALIVFLSRFSIDRKLIDYKDEIEKHQDFISYLKNNEEKFRDTQLKLAVSDKYTASSSATVNIFEELFNSTNDQLTISSLLITPSSITVTAQSSLVDNLSSFTNLLKNHPKVNSIRVDKIDSKPKSSLISITLTAQLNPKIK